jgi:hypothetical protein
MERTFCFVFVPQIVEFVEATGCLKYAHRNVIFQAVREKWSIKPLCSHLLLQNIVTCMG